MHGCVCMSVCAWVCVHECVCVCACMGVCAWVCVHECVCMSVCAWVCFRLLQLLKSTLAYVNHVQI